MWVAGCGGGANEAGPILHGANLPWLNYGHDFGRAWGDAGVVASRERHEADFDALVGTSVVRWFVFADGRALDTSTPEEVFADMDAALEIADARGIQLMPVLFDFLWFDPAVEVDGVQLFGRELQAFDPMRRSELMQTWVEPFAARYGDDERIYAIDLINEPEWVMDASDPDPMFEFLEVVAEPFWGRRPVTIGSASFDFTDEYWVDWGLDLLQIHHYENRGLPPAERLSIDVPVWVGEFPTVGGGVAERVLDYQALGYAGVMPWSLNGEDEATDRDALLEWSSGP